MSGWFTFAITQTPLTYRVLQMPFRMNIPLQPYARLALQPALPYPTIRCGKISRTKRGGPRSRWGPLSFLRLLGRHSANPIPTRTDGRTSPPGDVLRRLAVGQRPLDRSGHVARRGHADVGVAAGGGSTAAGGSVRCDERGGRINSPHAKLAAFAIFVVAVATTHVATATAAPPPPEATAAASSPSLSARCGTTTSAATFACSTRAARTS